MYNVRIAHGGRGCYSGKTRDRWSDTGCNHRSKLGQVDCNYRSPGGDARDNFPDEEAKEEFHGVENESQRCHPCGDGPRECTLLD